MLGEDVASVLQNLQRVAPSSATIFSPRSALRLKMATEPPWSIISRAAPRPSPDALCDSEAAGSWLIRGEGGNWRR